MPGALGRKRARQGREAEEETKAAGHVLCQMEGAGEEMSTVEKYTAWSKAGPETGLCESAWAPDVECVNRAEYILRNTQNAGFAIMCGEHLEGYLRSYTATHVVILAYSKELAEELHRKAVEAGL